MECPVWARRGCFKTVSEHYEDNYKRVTETIRLVFLIDWAKLEYTLGDAPLLTGRIQLLEDLIMKLVVMVLDLMMTNTKVNASLT